MVSEVQRAIDAGFLKQEVKNSIQRERFDSSVCSGLEVESWSEWSTSPEQRELIEQIDLSKAQARDLEDKKRIDSAVEKAIGFENSNQMVRDAIVAKIYHDRCAGVKKGSYTKAQV